MLSFREFWRRHKRKIVVTAGVVGGGYALYKMCSVYRERYLDSERESQRQREAEEIIKTQLQAHFESVQRIADTITLPYAVHHLRMRIAEELDLSHLRNRLLQGKSQHSMLTAKEKMELWDRLKILSFTRTALSIWSMTMLTLYSRVQVNILGRHLYANIARGLESPQGLDEIDPLDRYGQQEFLRTADYLSNNALSSLISSMQRAATEVLEEKQLRDPFNSAQLHETIRQILRTFANLGGSHYWLNYLLPDNPAAYNQLPDGSSECDNSLPSLNTSKLEQLMLETRSVLSGPDFETIVDVSLKKVVDEFMEDMAMDQMGGSSSGVPLAKLLPGVAQLGSRLLDEPGQNRFIRTIGSQPEVELFYTLVYTSNPAS